VPVPATATPWDWFHLNSIDHEPNGNLLLSARSTWAAYQLRAGSGEVLWSLGGSNSSFAMGPGTETAWQHDARIQPDGTITMFDDGSTPRVHNESRGLRVSIDYGRHAAHLVRSFPHPGAPLVSDSQGNMQTLPNQHVVVGWGAVPSVSEFAKDGALLLDAHLPPGFSSYRAFRQPWSGHPLWLPSVSARILATGDSTAVFASWNGASEVAKWRVLAGSAPESLNAQAMTPASEFESSVILPDAYSYVAVQALGAAGQLLATSPTERVQPFSTPAKGS
jgi:hypothetical protein